LFCLFLSLSVFGALILPARCCLIFFFTVHEPPSFFLNCFIAHAIAVSSLASPTQPFALLSIACVFYLCVSVFAVYPRCVSIPMLILKNCEEKFEKS
jgi:hypothetical protein